MREIESSRWKEAKSKLEVRVCDGMNNGFGYYLGGRLGGWGFEEDTSSNSHRRPSYVVGHLR